MTVHEDQFCALPNGLQLCFRTYGSVRGEPLVLVAGLGLDLTWWPSAFIDGLVRRGFFVITLDNRDAGRSSFTEERAPSLWRLLARRLRTGGYDLGDMADDIAALLHVIGVQSAHVVGMSMGGMIAQALAVRHPGRVRSLTSIFSTTGAPRVGRVALSTLRLLARPPARDERDSVERAVTIVRHISRGPHPFDEDEARAYAKRAWRRSGGARADAGFRRQLAAIFRSGNRTEALRSIVAPTLVIHGDEDRMVHPSGGRATAAAITGAEFITIRGLRHAFAAALVPTLIERIATHAALYSHRLSEAGAREAAS